MQNFYAVKCTQKGSRCRTLYDNGSLWESFVRWSVSRFHPCADGLQKCLARDRRGAFALDEAGEVAGHDAGADRVEAGLFEPVREGFECRKLIQLAALFQRACPREDRRHRVGRGLFALEVAVIMLRDRAVRGLKFCRAVWRDEHGGHHGERAERRGHHIAHHVAVIILAGPDEAALAADDAGDRVVDQRVEIPQAKRLELRPIALLVFFFKNALERAVIDLGNGILGGEPEILLRINGILEAGPRERADAAFLIVFALEDGGAVGFLDENGLLPAGCALM